MLNLYPPYLGTGIRVVRIAPDYREIDVEMKLRFYNRNYVRTHFGGSLYAMVDPFYMLMLIQILGREYAVWARFRVDDAMIRDIEAQTADGGKYEPVYPIDITDENGGIAARIRKTIYVRRKPRQAGR